MKHPSQIFVGAILCLLVLASCSGGNSSPIVTDLNPQEATTSPKASEIKQIWGYYNVVIDPDNESVEIVPIRSSEFTANVTMFLQPPAGSTSNLGIQILSLVDFASEGKIDVLVTLTHPFPGQEKYTGFDVMGVFIHDGDTVSEYDSSVMYGMGSTVARLLNADGFTRWYNPSEFTATGLLGFTEGALGTPNAGFTATINPYKYFCEEISSTETVQDFFHAAGNTDDRGNFRSTGSNAREYNLQFPFESGSPVVKFQYAVVANWEPPTVDPPTNIPGDFPEGANAKEPFHVAVNDNGSDIYYNIDEAGGTVRILAEIFDWGSGSNSAGVLGEFGSLIIENSSGVGSPQIFTPIDLAPSAVGSTDVSSIVDIEFPYIPENGGDQSFLLTIQDESLTYDQSFGVGIPDSPLASYFTFSVPVGIGPQNDCANITVTGANPPSSMTGDVVSPFVVTGTDFEDGANLAVDLLQISAIETSATNVVWVDETTITCDFDFSGVAAGDYTLRITNGCDPVSYATIDYTIDPWDCSDFQVLSSVPSSALINQTYNDVQITGDQFQNGGNLAVHIMNGAVVLVTATDVTYIDSSNLTCDLNFTGIPAGNYTLRVTNGCSPLSYDSIAFNVTSGTPGIKNNPLPAVPTDISVRESDGVAMIWGNNSTNYFFVDGYGSYTIGSLFTNAFDRCALLDSGYSTYTYFSANLDFNFHAINPAYYGSTPGAFLTGIISYPAATYQYGGIDVCEINSAPLNDQALIVNWVQELSSGNYFISIATKAPPTGTTYVWENFAIHGSGTGLVNRVSTKGIHVSKDNTDSGFDYWIYFVEGAPDYEIERFDFDWNPVGPVMTIANDLTIGTGVQGNGNNQFNNPLDISGDSQDRIFVLDILSTGQPVVKAYTKDGAYLGQFGNSTSISGTALRLDVNDTTDQVHVIHTNGVSVFNPSEFGF